MYINVILKRKMRRRLKYRKKDGTVMGKRRERSAWRDEEKEEEQEE